MIKKNWSLLLVAIALIAFPVWGKLSMLLARDQFLRLEDIVSAPIDPESPGVSQKPLDEIGVQLRGGWTLTDSCVYDGKLYLLLGFALFQDGHSYHFEVVRAQISDEVLIDVTDERAFQMFLYGADETRILYGKYYGDQNFELYAYDMEKETSVLIKDFGRLYELPAIRFGGGLTGYLSASGEWKILDEEGRPLEIDIAWNENSKIESVAVSPEHIYFYVDEDPLRFILVYDLRSGIVTRVQTGERISAIVPMDGAVLVERSGEPSRYSIGYFREKKFDKLREGEYFDYLRVISPELVEWVQADTYEVYDIKEKRIVFAARLTKEQKEDLLDEGLLFYLPPLESVRWVRPE